MFIETRRIGLHYKTCENLKKIKKTAESNGDTRTARRAHAILLNSSGYSSTQIAKLLFCNRSTASKWLKDYEEYGLESLFEGHRSGRPNGLTNEQKMLLGDIIDSGPVSYGYPGCVWSGKMLSKVIFDEFGLLFTERHTTRIIKEIGFSIQCPKRNLINSDPIKKAKWVRFTYPRLKAKAKNEGGVVLFEDEASFRQDSTLIRTWSRVGNQPLIDTNGARKSIKIFGAVDLHSARFLCKESNNDIFNRDSYLDFLYHLANHSQKKKIFLICDNASYHHDEDVVYFFKECAKWIEPYFLPPYSPELNPIECVWKYFRKTGIHNNYFQSIEDLRCCFRRVKKNIQNNPSAIRGYLKPFL